MNNDNIIKIINENGAEKEYGRIPDLWHIAMRRNKAEREAILQVWHMAHDFKAIAEGQGEAKLISGGKL